MDKLWDEAELFRHISDEIEESIILDYKGAGSLDRADSKKTEITKDVSAMANSAGGTLIYGLREFPKPKNHLPEKIDPVDRTKFSKEWLEQIINNIRPRIDGVIIHSVSLTSGPNDVAYVVEIPQSGTAHQALDHRYYRRFNFQSVAMEDHEVRDVMNRKTKPEASVTFDFQHRATVSADTHYLLIVKVKNSGDQVINNFKLLISFPKKAGELPPIFTPPRNHTRSRHADNDHLIDYQSAAVLFPQEERNIGEEMMWIFTMNNTHRMELLRHQENGTEMTFTWTLYADNMTAKHGTHPISMRYFQ